MKTSSLVFRSSLFLIMLVIFPQCSKEGAPPPIPTGRSKVYVMSSTNLSEVTGTATFIENEDNSTTINIKLEKMEPGKKHPIFIRGNVSAEGGGVALDLGFIDSNIGISSITVDKLVSGDKIGYEALINYNGYLGIDEINQNLGILIAYCDIGPNELTGQSITYGLVPANNSNVVGSAKFSERVNGKTLVEIGINAMLPNTEYPAYIYTKDVGEDGNLLITLTSVKSEKGGTSLTQIRSTIDETTISYTEILQLDAHIEMHPSPADLESVIAQGSIGSN